MQRKTVVTFVGGALAIGLALYVGFHIPLQAPKAEATSTSTTAPVEALAPAPAPTPTPESQPEVSSTQATSTPLQPEQSQDGASTHTSGCHNNDIVAEAVDEPVRTRDDRMKFLENMPWLPQYFDRQVDGDDGEYMIFSTPPDHAADLQAFALDLDSTETRANLCVKGFDYVEFIVHNPDGSQRLIKKIEIEPHDVWVFYKKHTVTPM